MSNLDDLNDQLLVRRQKMGDIRESGLDPFGSKFERTHLSEEIHEKYEGFTKEELEEASYEVKLRVVL